MPEIKHQFTGGKMNKDLDERLVPNGEYRHAENIQVSTSDNSNVGTVQNILGNDNIRWIDYNHPNQVSVQLDSSAVCIGSISDEKNDALYWFVKEESRDLILEYKNNQIRPVFVDFGVPNLDITYYFDLSSTPFEGSENTINISAITSSGLPVDYSNINVGDYVSVVIGNPPLQPLIPTLDTPDPIIQPGGSSAITQTESQQISPFIPAGSLLPMLPLGIDQLSSVAPMNIGSSYDLNLFIESIDANNNTITLNGDLSNVISFLNPNLNYVIKIHPAKKVLNFYKDKEGNPTMITGINIVDEMLFWTDGFTEPKKLNINNGKLGTLQNGSINTRLVNKSQFNFSNQNDLESLPFFEEKHLTVLKKAPKHTLDTEVFSRPEFAFGQTLDELEFAGQSTTPQSSPSPLSNGDSIGNLVLVLDEESIGTYNNVPINEGDVLLFNSVETSLSPQDEHIISVLVTQVYPNGIPGTFFNSTPSDQLISLDVTIISIPSDPDAGVFGQQSIYNWAVQLPSTEQTFKNKFPRFSYRYKYIDGEYSTFAPFTNVIFEPGDFIYQVKEAYNLGMENTLTKITLKNYTYNLPEDVVGIDLLYKESNSAIVYVIDTIEAKDFHDLNTIGGINLLHSYEIKPNMVTTSLPENQLLRAWDTVPRTALAQEVIGSRIVYGNYLQNYNLSNPKIKASLVDRAEWDFNVGYKSLKSIRNYSLGISYLDQYGRQTPVFTHKDADVEIQIQSSQNRNQIEFTPDITPPNWATHYKVFVKETSNEYYNLAMDRIYDAADGNVWIAFPSSDRNKVDEETFLILKKGIEQSSVVNEKNKYKILAIENEAPTFVKTKTISITLPLAQQNASGDDIFNEAPVFTSRTFQINKANWDADNTPLTEYEKPLAVRFSIPESLETTTIYDIIDLTTGGGDADGDPTYYNINLSKPIDQEYFTSGIEFLTTFFRKKVENRPEFDGRFFAKINRNVLLDKYITNEASVDITTEYETTQVMPFYFIGDTGSDFGYDNTSLQSTTNFSAGSNPNTGWDYLLNNNNNGDGFWFIDSAYYSGEYTPGSGTTFLTEQGMWQRPNESGSGNSYSVGSSKCPAQTRISGVRNGIYTNDAGEHFIDISFGPVSPDMADISPIDSWRVDKSEEYIEEHTEIEGYYDDSTGFPFYGPGGSVNASNKKAFYQNIWDHANDNGVISNFRVGSSENEEHEDQKSIHLKLTTPGQKFKFNGSEEVYEIIEHTVKYTLNYRSTNYLDEGWNQVVTDTNSISAFYAGSDPGVTENQVEILLTKMGDFGRKENKRVTYTLKLNKNPLEDTGENGFAQTMQDLSNNAPSSQTPGEIRFIETTFKTIDDQVVSQYPAIWETEPKQDVGLDIYHEVDSSFPMYINKQNNNSFAPVGSFVTSSNVSFPNLTSESSSTEVVSWQDNILTVSTSVVQDATSSILEFHKPDGSTVRARLISLHQPSGGTSNQLYIDPVVYDLPVDLSFFNCYSFGNGVESNRIRDDFNKVIIDKGAKASSTTEEKYEEENRKHGLIYSGLYNSTSGVNNLNQFIIAEKITKDVNPIYGSIQKLHARDTDLVTLCEDKVLKILANKDAVFNADGNPQLTANQNVLGQTVPFVGEYGISKNPESFASEAYRAYFTDKVRGKVMRLSMDGLTPISDHGMKDWFRDNLKLGDKLIGSYDDKKDEYNITLRSNLPNFIQSEYIATTVTFKENVKGWVSFKSFVPENAISCANEYYTFQHGKIWQHHVNENQYNNFYNVPYSSSFTVILNDLPGSIKSFTTLNYEGTQSKVEQLTTEVVNGVSYTDNEYYNLQDKDGWYVSDIETDQDKGSIIEFIEKEKKWFNYIRGKKLSVTNLIANDFNGKNFSHQGIGRLSQDAQDVTVLGCMDSTALNYNAAAQFDDPNNPCIEIIYGCMDSSAQNYSQSANVDDGSCVYPGCTDNSTINGAGIGVNGALNYNPQATTDDGTCIYCEYGCTDSTKFNYNSQATCDDGSCIDYIYGCTDNINNNVVNFDPAANTDDGSCDYFGCTNEPTLDSLGNNYNTAQNFLWDVGTYGPNYIDANGNSLSCIDVAANNAVYSQVLNSLTHSTNLNLVNQNPNLTNQLESLPPCASIDDGSCVFEGCTDNTAINYDSQATISQLDTCIYCADPNAFNYTLGSELQYSDASTDACEYCPQVENISITDVTNSGFKITWQNPSQVAPPPGSTSTGDNGVYMVKIYWGMTSNVPPFTSIGPGGGGYFQYIPYFLENGTQSYPAITPIGDGMLSIAVSTAGINLGVVVGTGGILPSTDYSVAIDTFCTNDTGGFDANGNAISNIPTEFTASNGPGQAQTTTLATPIHGCTELNAFNYNPNATVDDGSCVAISFACTDPTAVNFTPDFPGLSSDNSMCVYQGCTDDTACNYIANAMLDCSGNALVDGVAADNSCCNFCGDGMALNFSGIVDTSCVSNCTYCQPLEAGLPMPGAPFLDLMKVSYGPNNNLAPTAADFNESTGFVTANFFLQIPASYDLSTVATQSGSSSGSLYSISYKLINSDGVGPTFLSQVLTTNVPGDVIQYTSFNGPGSSESISVAANTVYDVFIQVTCLRDDGQAVLTLSTTPLVIDTTVV